VSISTSQRSGFTPQAVGSSLPFLQHASDMTYLCYPVFVSGIPVPVNEDCPISSISWRARLEFRQLLAGVPVRLLTLFRLSRHQLFG
jgi:hypothetical protein